ncbi:GntT/GntP/DsdX family permease, partial [Streptomyces umbrinus]
LIIMAISAGSIFASHVNDGGFWIVARGTLVFVAMLTSVLSFRVFDQVYVLVKGGGLNEDAGRTVMYQAVTTAFDQNNVGQAAAITVVFFLIVVALTLIQRRVVRPDNED